MIERTKSFKTSDGCLFLDESEAQIHELKSLLAEPGIETITPEEAAKRLVVCKSDVLAILSTRKPRTPKAKPAAKKSKPQIVTEAA